MSPKSCRRRRTCMRVAGRERPGERSRNDQRRRQPTSVSGEAVPRPSDWMPACAGMENGDSYHFPQALIR
jgi:hypothetical protein